MLKGLFSTIRGKIFISLITLSLVLMVVLVFISISLFGIVSRYDNTLNELVDIYKITSISNQYAEKYLSAIQNVSVSRYSDDYNDAKESLKEAMSSLNLEQSSEIVIKSRGIMNIVKKVIEAGDSGLQSAKNGNIAEGFKGYEDINNFNFYIKENIASLAILQLKQVETIQTVIQQERQNTIYLIGGLGVLIIIASYIYARYFSGFITNPLLELSNKIETFSGQNYKTDIDVKFVNRKDEVGLLARTFEEMRQRIINSMQAQQKAQEELVKLNQKLESSNRDLSRMNEVMIGREMKMIEQKKEIDEIKARLGES